MCKSEYAKLHSIGCRLGSLYILAAAVAALWYSVLPRHAVKIVRVIVEVGRSIPAAII